MPHEWSEIEEKVRKRLMQDHAHPILVDSFLKHARYVHAGSTGLISGGDIAPVADIVDYGSLGEQEAEAGRAALRETVMIKLNGGLGTGMGLNRAKSLLPVKKGLSFLDIIARQVLKIRARNNAALPLLFMTSYSTDTDTLEAFSAYPDIVSGQPDLPLTFLQHRVPKLNADTLLPAEYPQDQEKTWCPPGHGDIYTALMTSGVLEMLVAAGYRYAFISNADNLGAVIDPSIPGLMRIRSIPFLIEVTDRTEADKKGGHLAVNRRDGRLLLRESAQCPADEKDDFQDIGKYTLFNTNNIWIDLSALRDLIRTTGRVPDLVPMINRKTLDPRDDTSPPVLQLETAMGAAISSFDGATAMRVPRTRFAPVKTTDDLLGLWSDAYELTDDMHIRLSADRDLREPPIIKLDPHFYKKIDDFAARFPEGAPSLINCRRLTVHGDIVFHAPLTLSDDVEYNNHGDTAMHVREDGSAR